MVDYADNNFWQQPNLPFVSKPSQLIAEFILIPHSDGEFYLSKSEGAHAALNYFSSQLTVDSIVNSTSKPTQLIVNFIPIQNSEGAQAS